MISAKWLFEKHRNHLAMAAFYEEELKRLEIEKDEIIEGMALAGPSIEKRPCGSGISNPTERIFLHYGDEMDYSARLMEVRQKQSQNQYWLHLYSIILSCYPKDERWIIEQHYTNGVSQTALTSIVDSPTYGLSRSTVSRWIKRITEKADVIIQELEAPP